MIIDNTDKNFLMFLINELNNIPQNIKGDFLIDITKVELMKLPIMLRFFRWIFGSTKFYIVLKQTFVQKPNILDTMFNEFTNHMLNGKDRYDKKSAGGFNKEELEDIVELMKKYQWKI
jgi:hypothetical protein